MRVFGATQCSSRELLTHILSNFYGISALPAVAKTEDGKPYFPDCPALQFSLSHSGNLVLCALDGHPVGIDIELVAPRRGDLPAFALTEHEFSRYQLLGADWPAFYTLWTKKEAWCKYTGRGLGKNFRNTPPETGLCYRSYQHKAWWATVCGETEPPAEIHWLEPGKKGVF